MFVKLDIYHEYDSDFKNIPTVKYINLDHIIAFADSRGSTVLKLTDTESHNYPRIKMTPDEFIKFVNVQAFNNKFVESIK